MKTGGETVGWIAPFDAPAAPEVSFLARLSAAEQNDQHLQLVHEWIDTSESIDVKRLSNAWGHRKRTFIYLCSGFTVNFIKLGRYPPKSKGRTSLAHHYFYDLRPKLQVEMWFNYGFAMTVPAYPCCSFSFTKHPS